MKSNQYRVVKSRGRPRELHVGPESSEDPIIRIYKRQGEVMLSAEHGAVVPWRELRENVDRFLESRIWTVQPKSQNKYPELLAVRALLTTYLQGDIEGLEFSRAYFVTNRAIQIECPKLPKEVLTALDHLFVELNETVWPTEPYMKTEVDGVWYNGPESVKAIIEDTISEIDRFV